MMFSRHSLAVIPMTVVPIVVNRSQVTCPERFEPLYYLPLTYVSFFNLTPLSATFSPIDLGSDHY